MPAERDGVVSRKEAAYRVLLQRIQPAVLAAALPLHESHQRRVGGDDSHGLSERPAPKAGNLRPSPQLREGRVSSFALSALISMLAPPPRRLEAMGPAPRLVLLIGLLLQSAAGLTSPPHFFAARAARTPLLATRLLPLHMEVEGATDAAETPEEEAQPPAPPPPPPSCEPVFALESRDTLGLRVSTQAGTNERTSMPTYEAVRAALLSLGDSEEVMTAFMQANRDLIDYRFLYRLTSEKLRAMHTGDRATEKTLTEVRARAVRAAQRFDAPLFKEVGEAETRLGGLLAQYMQGKNPTAADVVGVAGETPLGIFAFWMVLLSAVAAWEAKLPLEAVADQARGKLQQLGELRAAVEADDGLLATAGIGPLSRLFRESDVFNPETGAIAPSLQFGMLNARCGQLLVELLPDEVDRTLLIRRVGCLYCQAQRHGFGAYNPMVARAAALYDILLYGEMQPLTAVDTKKPDTDFFNSESGLVTMAAEAEQLMLEQGEETILYW